MPGRLYLNRPGRAPVIRTVDTMHTITEIFAEDGVLAGQVRDYARRPQQQEMAEAVADAIERNGVLVAEAGTGTGKTFAYLVPALLSGKKTLVSTGTRNLQDQLFFRDLPFVRQALGLPSRVAMLKGRSNYLCLYRLHNNQTLRRLRQPAQLGELEAVRRWADRTTHGDISELPDIAEDSPLWPLVTATADNCLGNECEQFNDCYLTRARRAAAQADIVVINHHLFLADQVLRDEGFGEVLPGAEVVIFDEAHQLAEAANNFFGISVTSRQIRLLFSQCRELREEQGLDWPQLDALETRVEDLLDSVRKDLGDQERRLPWSAIKSPAAFRRQLEELNEVLEELLEHLDIHCEQYRALDKCRQRCEQFGQRLRTLNGELSGNWIPWLEVFRNNFSLHGTPVSVAEDFGRIIDDPARAWIFTSATLSAGDDFRHFLAQMGLEHLPVHTEEWQSPFDYHHQALLYVPRGLPEPSHPDYTLNMMRAALPVLRASRGRAFVLFTSYRAMYEAETLLREHTDFNLFVQGRAAKMELLDGFKTTDKAVLLGTTSFWEGVDVRGERLSCVIIDKLPFASPGDPVMQGRLQAIEAQGHSPFWSLQVPQAVIMLKQGMGRLIRDVSDTGVLMLCDPRLYGKGYGRKFLGSLPAMPVCRDIAEVRAFFAAEARREMAR